jgi:hypothetical protein
MRFAALLDGVENSDVDIVSRAAYQYAVQYLSQVFA